MADAPSTPWTLPCPWCTFALLVNARGARSGDEGAGVEAAHLMQRHVAGAHGRTWAEFLATEGTGAQDARDAGETTT